MAADRVGAAKRRRERRLRQFLRHERLNVAMALRSVLGLRRTKPHGDRRQLGQLGRGQSLLRRCPSRRLGAVTVGGYVDARGFSSPRRRQEEVAEHERRMRVLDRRVWADEQLTPEESLAWRAWAGHLPGRKRKRKKRRKRKLPKSSSSGCRRPCALQRHVPAVLRVDSVFASVHRRLLDFPVVLQIQVRGSMDLKTVVVLVVAHRLFPMVQAVLRTIEIPWLLDTVIDVPVAQVLQVVVFPVVVQRPVPTVQTVRRTKEISQFSFDKVIDVPAGRASSTGAVVEETVVLPRLHSLRDSLCAAHRLGDELRLFFLRALHTGARPGGSCPQGHGLPELGARP